MVKKDHKKIKSIRRYLKNQMSPVERMRFEKGLQADQDLKDEVDLYRLVIYELNQRSSTDSDVHR